MTFRRISAARFLLSLVFFCIPIISAEAQSSNAHEDKALESLLKEVRLLRETLQRLNLNAYRSQIIVERMRAQNERVTRLSRMLEDARDEMADLQIQVTRLSERSKAVENLIQQEADLKQRTQLEVEQQELKYAVDQQKQRQDRLRERESRMATELQIEQSKLGELEGRLDAMEREIENEMERQRDANEEKSQKRKPQP